MDVKTALSAIASAISVLAYIPYLINIWNGKTKPHVFSWLVWTVLTGIAFFGQIASGEGSGSWLLGISTFFCVLVTALSFYKGTRDIQKIDWICMTGAFMATGIWLVTKSPLLSVFIIIITDLLSFYPTIRKSYRNPKHESASLFLVNSIKYVVGIFALRNVTVITALYPAYLAVANGFFVAMLYVRRRQIGE